MLNKNGIAAQQQWTSLEENGTFIIQELIFADT